MPRQLALFSISPLHLHPTHVLSPIPPILTHLFSPTPPTSPTPPPGKEKKITIENDRGRLSKDEVDRLVQEAERFKAEDEANRSRVEAKSKLENHIYQLKDSLEKDEVRE